MRTGNCGRIILFFSMVLTGAGCGNELDKFLADDSKFLSDQAARSATLRVRRLTLANSSSATTLTDFPVMVRLNSSRIDYTRMQSAGQDLRFYDSDGVTALAYEIEKWDSTGESIAWVKIPQIDALSASDSIVMKYGDASLGDGQNANAVWSNGHAGVWHFASGINALRDATSNANHATDFGSASATGMIGGARQVLAVSGQYLRAPTVGISASAGTMEILAYPISTGSAGNAMFIVSIWDGSAGNRIYLMQRNTVDPNDFRTALGSQGAPFTDSTQNMPTNDWSYCVLTWSGGTYQAFFNGSPVDSGTYFSLSAIDTSIYFGSGSVGAPTFSWDGRFDEARVSNTARSADWVAAQYKSLSDTYISFGPEYQ